MKSFWRALNLSPTLLAAWLEKPSTAQLLQVLLSLNKTQKQSCQSVLIFTFLRWLKAILLNCRHFIKIKLMWCLLKRPIISVNPDVFLQRTRIRGCVGTKLTLERLVARMNPKGFKSFLFTYVGQGNKMSFLTFQTNIRITFSWNIIGRIRVLKFTVVI